ncbi:MAG: hypothetical protein U5R06_02265 [candidate division KSB1 bacterium]|nr:hypothetical protein [candidate division KSB1 bacterium]
MAKVKAPLFSLKAQGTLGKKITYRTHKQNTTVTRWSKPTGQASQAQLQNRVKMKQARFAWSDPLKAKSSIIPVWALSGTIFPDIISLSNNVSQARLNCRADGTAQTPLAMDSISNNN